MNEFYLRAGKQATVEWLGSVDISAKPNKGTGKVQKAKIAACQLVKARKDPTKMLDLVDETFNQMALTIQPMIVLTGLLGVLTRGDHDFCTALYDQCDKILSAIAAIGDHMLKLESIDQVRGLGNVMPLSSRQAQPQRIAQTIDGQVDFGAKPTATTPQRLIIWFSVFFQPLLRRDAPERWYCQLVRFPYPGRQQSVPTSAPRPRCHTSGQSAYRWCSSSRNRPAADATALRSGLPKSRLQRIVGTEFLSQHKHAGRYAEILAFLSIGRLAVSRLSSDQFTSNVNTT